MDEGESSLCAAIDKLAEDKLVAYEATDSALDETPLGFREVVFETVKEVITTKSEAVRFLMELIEKTDHVMNLVDEAEGDLDVTWTVLIQRIGSWCMSDEFEILHPELVARSDVRMQAWIRPDDPRHPDLT
jgi:hypothetical protein